MRHAQSAGNVARDEAETAGLPLIDIATRDINVPDCSVTSYEFDLPRGKNGKLVLRLITVEADMPAAPRP